MKTSDWALLFVAFLKLTENILLNMFKLTFNNLRLPQLVAELQLRPSLAIARIISHVGESNEQQVFYAIAASQPLDFVVESVSTGYIY